MKRFLLGFLFLILLTSCGQQTEFDGVEDFRNEGLP
jgi:hypothetical protein